MEGEKEKKIIKTIRIDVDKCNGCRACEVICSAFHATPKYSSNNPARARIRVIRDPLADIYIPVYAGEYAVAECAGRNKYTIDGKEYDECAFCRASCPSRAEFIEPDSGLPLKCDMCEGEEEPLCLSYVFAEFFRVGNIPIRSMKYGGIWNLHLMKPMDTPIPLFKKVFILDI